MAYIFVVPRPGVRVRHPDTGQALAPGGERVALSSYWRRREKDGDVTLGTISDAPVAAIEAAPTAASPETETKTAKKGK